MIFSSAGWTALCVEKKKLGSKSAGKDGNGIEEKLKEWNVTYLALGKGGSGGYVGVMLPYWMMSWRFVTTWTEHGQSNTSRLGQRKAVTKQL